MANKTSPWLACSTYGKQNVPVAPPRGSTACARGLQNVPLASVALQYYSTKPSSNPLFFLNSPQKLFDFFRIKKPLYIQPQIAVGINEILNTENNKQK